MLYSIDQKIDFLLIEFFKYIIISLTRIRVFVSENKIQG